MMNVTRRYMMSVAVAALFGGGVMAGTPAQAAERPEAGDEASAAEQRLDAPSRGEAQARDQQAQDQEMSEQGRLLKATGVVDYEVRDQQGQKLGTVNELAIDVHHGQIAYAILEFDEPITVAQPIEGQVRSEQREESDAEAQAEASTFAVPWQALRVTDSGDALELTIDQHQLAQLGAFDDQWEQLSQMPWATRHHETLDLTPYWSQEGEGDGGLLGLGDQEGDQEGDASRQAQRPEREGQAGGNGDAQARAANDEQQIKVKALSDLTGREIHNPEDEALAEIDDFMVDTREGRLAYAILSYGGILGIGSDLVAVPYQALQLDAEEEAFVLDADEDTLDQLAFDNDEWPDMTNEQWTQQTHDTFGQEPYWQAFGYAPPNKVGEDEPSEEMEN